MGWGENPSQFRVTIHRAGAVGEEGETLKICETRHSHPVPDLDAPVRGGVQWYGTPPTLAPLRFSSMIRMITLQVLMVNAESPRVRAAEDMSSSRVAALDFG